MFWKVYKTIKHQLVLFFFYLAYCLFLLWNTHTQTHTSAHTHTHTHTHTHAHKHTHTHTHIYIYISERWRCLERLLNTRLNKEKRKSSILRASFKTGSMSMEDSAHPSWLFFSLSNRRKCQDISRSNLGRTISYHCLNCRNRWPFLKLKDASR